MSFYSSKKKNANKILHLYPAIHLVVAENGSLYKRQVVLVYLVYFIQVSERLSIRPWMIKLQTKKWSLENRLGNVIFDKLWIKQCFSEPNI